MKFIVSIVLVLCFIQNALASTNGLNALIDEYQYFLTVEWDQKDLSLQKENAQKFEQKVKTLFAEGDLTQEEFLKTLEQRIPNKKALERVRLRLALSGNKLSPQEIANVIEEFKADLYKSGSSWNAGEVALTGLYIALGILLIGALIWEATLTDCQVYGSKNACDENGEWREYVCSSYKDEWRCTSITKTDSYGNEKTETKCAWEKICQGGYYK
jgi:hypothetical protein